MALSTSTLVMFLSSLLIFISTSNAISPGSISQICSRSINPRLCFSTLNSNPRVASSDLKGVGAIVLDISNSKASQTKSIIPSLAAKASNPTLKQRYNECLRDYNEVVVVIAKAKQALGANDPRTVNIRVSAAQTEIGDCVDSFSSPPRDSSDLTKRSRDLFDTLSIVLVISNLL
ncbi:hypothetical protein QQ045_018216 [Rhodiola kirilowii]